ncbi:MAG: cation:proton antiporter [Vicinamibacterales bacterium]
MELLYILLVLLLVARVAAELARRAGAPELIGELIGGIGLGLLVQQSSGSFPVLSELADNDVFRGFTDLAMFFLMLLAGVEIHPGQLSRASRAALGIALGGMLLPLAAGFGLASLALPDSPFKFAQSLFVATALAVTAVPVSVKVLMDLGQLKTRLGLTIVSAAVIDDVLALLVLAVLTGVVRTGTVPAGAELAGLAGRVALFFVIVGVVGGYVYPWLGRQLKAAHAQEFEFSALLIAALTFSLLAEALSLHFILGAFLAGLFFGQRTLSAGVYEKIKTSLTTFTAGLFAPLFFASVGMHLDLQAALVVPGFVAALVLAAFAGKLAGAALPALAAGFSLRQSIGIGAAMSARGAVELVVADVALRAGLFEVPAPPPPEVAYLFSAVVIMAIVTTLIGPLVLKGLITGERLEPAGDEG